MAASDIVQPEIAVSFPQRTGSVHHDLGFPVVVGGLFDEEDERFDPKRRTRALDLACTCAFTCTCTFTLVHLIALETSKR